MVENKDKTPVAQDVITMCTKCKMELNHVVISHNMDGIVSKVKCHTCGTEHKYKPARNKVVKKSQMGKKAGNRSKKPTYEEKFAKLADIFKGKKSVPYSISGKFKKEDVIDHKTFGRGFITDVSYQKIEVAFSDGIRLLACERENVEKR